MRRLLAALRRCAGLFRQDRRDRELDAELASHLQMHIDDNVRAGMTPEEARRQAFVRLGGLESVKGACRDRRGVPALESLIQDVRFGLRMLRKSPGFTTVAILTLALGIGSTTAIFSVIDHVMLRPLAYREADRLFAIHEVVPQISQEAPKLPVNARHFDEWQRTIQSFEQMALVDGGSVNLTGAGEPERIAYGRTSPNLFSMLGVQARLGRTFIDADGEPGRDRVAVLDEDLWKRRFAADPAVIGRTAMLDGEPYEIVGVLPGGFRFPKLSHLYDMAITDERPQIWLPLAFRAEDVGLMGDFNFACIARVRPDVSAAQALSELDVVQARLAKQIAMNVDLQATLVPLQAQITGRSRTGLQLMLAAVAAVLLVGCVNLANLFLARSSDRRREIAIRQAMGASGARLMRQVFVESLLYAVSGGLLGVAIAYSGMRFLLVWAPVDLPRMDEIHLDAGVLLFTLAISSVVGLLVGVLPARWLAGRDPQDAMKTGSRGMTAARQRGSVRSILVGLEVGVSAMCMIAAGLLLHSFVKVLNAERGFEGQRVAAASVTLPNTRYPDFANDKVVFVRSMLEQVSSLPGVASTGVVNRLPLSGVGGNNGIQVEGTNVPPIEQPLADIRLVSPAYFRTIGIPLRAGRTFDEASDRTRPIAVVSAMTAERAWPGQNPLGKRFRTRGGTTPPIEVVGVVGDVRGVSLNRDPNLTVYLPYWQLQWSDQFSFSLVVRAAADVATLSSAVRSAIQRLDPELPVGAVRTMDEIVSESVAERRFQMHLLLLFAVAATLLASLGIYGVASYSVAQRTNEIGIRTALGAHARSLRHMVIRQSLWPVAVGLVAGVGASLMLGRVLESLLYGVSPADPPTIAGVTVLLIAVAGIAVYVPARRATHIDPLVALRYE